MEVCPPKVVKCDECETPRKDLKVIHHCPSCEQYLCDGCDKKMHGKGKRMAHERKQMATHTHFAPGTPPVAAHGGIPDSVAHCDECEGARDTVKVRCDACEQWLCEKCNTKLHKAGKRMAHVRKYFGGGSAPPVQGDKEVAPASVKACNECETPRAELDVVCQCEPCEQWLCEPCDDKLHKKGKRMAHVRKHFGTKDAAAPANAPDLAPAAAVKCDECEATRDSLDNIVRCDACEQWLCPNCDEKMHKKGKRIAHERHAYVTKSGAKPLASKPKPNPETKEPATPKSPLRQSPAAATLTRAVSKAKVREDDDNKAADEEKEKKKKEEDAAARKKKDEEDKKRRDEERQRAEAERQRLAKEKEEAEKAKTERERKSKEAEAKRAAEKVALEEKKRKEEEELRLKIEREAQEQLEREEAEKDRLRKEKAERKKARDDKRKVKAEKQAKKEADEKAAAEKAEAERLLREKAEGELRAKLEAEARAKVEAEMRAKVEAEMRAKAEEEERQREKKERAERKVKEEKERAERKAKDEAERAERNRKEKEELARKQKEEAERLEREEREAREKQEREEAEERARQAEIERQEAEAAERTRQLAASPKRRPPPTVVGKSDRGATVIGKERPEKKSFIGGADEDEGGIGLGDFDDGPDDPVPAPAEAAAAAADLGPEEDVNFLKKGLIAIKHDTSFGKKTQKRDMWYEMGPNGGNLQWGRPGEKRVADKKKQMGMVTITEVWVGKGNTTFKKMKEGAEPCCFSIVSKERTLDLECTNESERDSFVRAVQHICKEHMISIQMHGSPKPRPGPVGGKPKKGSVAGGAGARAMSPSTAGARAVSPSNAKRPQTMNPSSRNTLTGQEPPNTRVVKKKPAAGDKRTCDDCLDASAVLAVQCEECEQVLCADCDARIHKKGTRAAHQRSPYVEGSAGAGGAGAGAAEGGAGGAAGGNAKHICQDCQDASNEVVCHCAECEQFLCHDCDARIHKKGTRSKHVREYFSESAATAPISSPASSMREGALSPAKGAGKADDGKEALGNQAFNNKKYDKAVGFFSDLINQNPAAHKYFLKRGNSYFFMDKYSDALADANQSIELAPQVLEAYILKGKALDKLGKLADAIAAVQDGLRIEPANVPLKQALSKLREQEMVSKTAPPSDPAPAPKGKGHARQPSRQPPPPTKAPPSTAVSVFNPKDKDNWDGEKDDEGQKKDKADTSAAKAGIKAKLETGAGKKGPPPLPSGKAAAAKKEPPPLKKVEKKAAEPKPEKKKQEEEAPPPAEEAPPPAGDDEWQEHVDPSTGNKYWHNANTQETTWDDPHAAQQDEWGEAKDPGTGKTYWFNTKTGATTWENPHGSEWAESADPTTGKPFWYHVVSGQTTWDNPAEAGKKKEPVSVAGPAIPTGMAVPKVVTVKNADWSEVSDPGSGNMYYVNNKTQATTWSNPHQWNEWVDKSTGKKYWNNEVTGATTWEYPK